jgi:hypothetical protein
MAHHFTFTVTVELERESGKFASRDEMAESIIGEIESMDPGYVSGIGADGDSEYQITNWEVEEA